MLCGVNGAYIRQDTKEAVFKEASMYYHRLTKCEDVMAEALKDRIVKIAIFVENYQVADSVRENVFPEILVGNDRSPRAGRKAIIYDKATPDAFYEGVTRAVEQVSEKDSEHRIIFLNSWNEWGEGSYMEPDQRDGHGFLEALRRALN